VGLSSVLHEQSQASVQLRALQDMEVRGALNALFGYIYTLMRPVLIGRRGA